MDHRMAVSADGAKVLDGIDFVLMPDGSEFSKVMNVDETFAYLSVKIGK